MAGKSAFWLEVKADFDRLISTVAVAHPTPVAVRPQSIIAPYQMSKAGAKLRLRQRPKRVIMPGARLLPFFRTQGIISAVYSFSRASTVMRPALWRAERRRLDSSRAGRYQLAEAARQGIPNSRLRCYPFTKPNSIRASLHAPTGGGISVMAMKLYVGNLNFKTTGEDLQELFGQVGTVESASVVMDRETGRSRGFGFVEMSSSEEGQKAIDQFNGKDFNGRNLSVNEARPREDRGGGGGGGYGGGGGGGRGGYGGGGGGNRGGGGGYGGGGDREPRW
jgi:hypothetical protein